MPGPPRRPLTDKASGNFCECFEWAMRNFTPATGGDTRAAKARDDLKKLLGDRSAARNAFPGAAGDARPP
jgi:hypothetical protein